MKNYETHNETEFEYIGGMELQDHVETSYANLVELFGEPHKGDRREVDAEWDIKFKDGTCATIYNFKSGKSFNGEKGTPVEDIKIWHIGGTHYKAAIKVIEVLDKADALPKGEDKKGEEKSGEKPTADNDIYDHEAENMTKAIGMDIDKVAAFPDFVMERTMEAGDRKSVVVEQIAGHYTKKEMAILLHYYFIKELTPQNMLKMMLGGALKGSPFAGLELGQIIEDDPDIEQKDPEEEEK